MNGTSIFCCPNTALTKPLPATGEEFAFLFLQRLLDASQGDQLAELEVYVASGPGQKACASWNAMEDALAG